MSTLATDAAAIKAAMTGYTELKGGLKLEQAPSSNVHKVYTFRVGEPDIRVITSNTEISSRLIRLRVSYRIDASNSFESNYDLFETLYNTIKALAGFVNMARFEYDYAEDETGRTTIGEFDFYYGIRTC